MLHSNLVKQRVPHEIVLVSILELVYKALILWPIFLELIVEDSIPNDWEGSESDVVHLINDFLVEGLSGEGGSETEEKLSDDV